MTEQNKPKIVFAPGAFDQFEGTQEELDDFMAELTQMFEGKTHEELMAMGTPLTEESFEELPDHIKEVLMSDEIKRTLN